MGVLPCGCLDERRRSNGATDEDSETRAPGGHCLQAALVVALVLSAARLLTAHPPTDAARGRVRARRGSTLLAAVWAGDETAALQLIGDGADVDVRDSGGDAPLHLASIQGQVDVVAALLAHGAEIDAEDKWGWTALHYAAREGRLDVAKALLAGGANAHAKGVVGESPLAVARRHSKRQVVKILEEIEM